MFFVLNVIKPDASEVTRLTFGCQEPAEFALNTLVHCGYDVEPDVTAFAPVRDENEAKRAQQLSQLIFAAVEGHS